jgi:hypothetical protein
MDELLLHIIVQSPTSRRTLPAAFDFGLRTPDFGRLETARGTRESGAGSASAALPTPVSAGSGSKGLLSIPIRDTPGGKIPL